MSDAQTGSAGGMVIAIRGRNEQITHFEAYGLGYYALLQNGQRLDFVRVESFQPPIANFDDYCSYLFVEAPSGFFILRQRIVENKLYPWELRLEIEAREPAHFFRLMCRRAAELLDLAESLGLEP
jgi:hypothetical protein